MRTPPGKKNAGLPGRRFCEKVVGLGFGEGDGGRGANFHATLTSQALILVDRDGFPFLHLEDARRANVDAFLVPSALVRIDFNPPGH
jgi:hypothetical protein